MSLMETQILCSLLIEKNFKRNFYLALSNYLTSQNYPSGVSLMKLASISRIKSSRILSSKLMLTSPPYTSRAFCEDPSNRSAPAELMSVSSGMLYSQLQVRYNYWCKRHNYSMISYFLMNLVACRSGPSLNVFHIFQSFPIQTG